jgi:hypothetical protein
MKEQERVALTARVAEDLAQHQYTQLVNENGVEVWCCARPGSICHPEVAGALTSHAFSGGAGGRPDGAAAGHFLVAPTLAGGGRKTGGYRFDDIPCVAATLDASYRRLQGCSG